MLRIIQGSAKTGKSTRIREELLEAARGENAEGKLLLFVPEQFSFETERTYADALGMKEAGRVRVVSFARFAGDMFREFGGLAGTYATDTARLITMKLALQECRGELGTYERLAAMPDFPSEMVGMVAEFKNAGLSGEDLDRVKTALPAGRLRDKLLDLDLLWSSYETLLSEHYVDGLDDLGRAAMLCAENQWFAGKKIWLDGFKSFTAVQERMIGLMLSQKAEVTVTLPIGAEPGDTRFAVPAETAKRLRMLAYQAGESVPKPEQLTEAHGFSSEALRYFSEQILLNNPLPFEGENDAVECAALFHEFDEAEFAAARIRQYVRETGCAFEDIAVLTRNMNLYAPLLEAAFERYDVPFYMDRVESVDILPLFRFVTHLMQAAAGGFSREEMLALLKCGILDITLEEIAAFESYTYVWNIDRSQFLQPFTQNPAGYSTRPMTEQEAAELESAEKIRLLTTGWIGVLQNEYEAQQSWPRALYAVLTQMDLPARIGERILTLQQENRQKDSDDLRRSWEVLVELLSTMDTILGEREMSLRDFASLFAVSAAGYDLGRIPQTLDSVLIGSAERVRLSGKKIVLVLGANDREFPLLPSPKSIFTEQEREILAAAGLELSARTEDAILEEKFVAWQALSSPSQALTISYSLGNLRGEQRYPSAIPEGFRTIFPKTPVRFPDSFPPEFFCQTPRTAYLQAIRRSRELSPFAPSARAYLEDQPDYAERMQELDRIRSENRLSLRNSELANAMFGGDHTFSPSQIERFFNCRFQYFCQYGLRLRSRGKAELNPMSRGNIIHYLLEQMLSRGDFFTIEEAELRRRVEEVLTQYLEETMGGQEQTRRFLYLYHRMAENALRVLLALRAEFAQTEFAVAGLEEPIYPGGRITPLDIPIKNPDGTVNHIHIAGKIDRVDRLEKDGKGYVRIIDYKTGHKEFSLDEVAEGLNLQMLLYLFAIWKGGKKELKDLTPAGILYLPARVPEPSLPRDAGEEQQRAAVEESFAMNGLLLDNKTVLCAMERDLEGKFLPVSMGKTKMKGEKWLAALEDFENLEWYAVKLIQSMESGLLAGEIGPNPIQCGLKVPCSYCDFRAICGFEDTDGFRTTHPVKLEEFAAIRHQSEKEAEE